MNQFFSLLIAILVTGCASVEASAVNNESLNYAIPNGWQKAHSAEDEQQSILEFIPEGQKLSSWDKMITVQSFSNPEKYHPEKFILGMAKSAQSKCAKVKVKPVINSQQNGYEFSQKLIFCTYKGDAGHEIFQIKAIKGREKFYTVQFRTGWY